MKENTVNVCLRIITLVVEQFNICRVFSGCSSTSLIKIIMIIHVIKNSTCGCIATLFIGLPNFFAVDFSEIWVYLGVRTCEVFLCLVTIIFLGSIVLISLFSLFYVTCERNRFLHRGTDEPEI